MKAVAPNASRSWNHRPSTALVVALSPVSSPPDCRRFTASWAAATWPVLLILVLAFLFLAAKGGLQYLLAEVPLGPVHDALLDSALEHVTCQHETMAVHMAAGYARATGRPGVVMVTSGPGTLNALTGP